MDLRGRRVVLTGASRGIGVAIAEALAAEGAHLVLSARDEVGLRATAARVVGAGGMATVVAGDIASPAGRDTLLQAAGEVDVLVNNAGVEVPVAIHDQAEADVELQVAVNLLAPMLLTRAVLPGMIARGRGAVVAVSSMSGKSPTPWNAVYAATKHGLNGFMASVGLELAGSGVHAAVVCPSFVGGVGMWADWGVAAPRRLREVPVARVVDGVRRAIDGEPEVLVTPGPIRPLLAIGQLVPGLGASVLRRLGVLAVFRARARAVAARRGVRS